MADRSHIEWTDATWNPINGCSVVSPGCTNCYAMKLAGTRLKHHPSRAGLTIDSKAGPVWNGQVRLDEKALLQPLRWARPRKIFVCAHGDLFHENVPDDWIDRVFAVAALAPQHVYQILTKRPERMRAYFTQDDGFGRWGYIEGRARQMAKVPDGVTLAHYGGSNLPNVWLGVSVEDQARADERIPILLDTPAAVRWISAEPLLGPINLTGIQAPRFFPEDHELDWKFSALETGSYFYFTDDLGVNEGGDGPDRSTKIDWVVAGGESGPGARPMHPDWARRLRDQCAQAEVPFLFKQWGDWAPGEIVGSVPYPIRRSLDVAWWFDERWSLGRQTPTESMEAHADDEPAVYRIGKRAAGRLLDGVQHDGYPTGACR